MFYELSTLNETLAVSSLPGIPSQEGDVYLEDLVKDIVQWLCSPPRPKADSSSSCSSISSSSSGGGGGGGGGGLQGNGLLLTTLSQYYFLFLGTLSAHRHGVKVLEKGSVYQWSVGQGCKNMIIEHCLPFLNLLLD